jgi:hypothetical protein
MGIYCSKTRLSKARAGVPDIGYTEALPSGYCLVRRLNLVWGRSYFA